MNNYRSRPKGNYIQEATWQELYMLTENWKNDLEFYLLDIEFLERLVDTYLVKLLTNQNFDELRELQGELLERKKQCKKLLNYIQIHFSHIVDLIDNPIVYDALVFRAEHELLEEEISEFKIMLKAVRYTVFNMTKGVLESEKPLYIWKYN